MHDTILNVPGANFSPGSPPPAPASLPPAAAFASTLDDRRFRVTPDGTWLKRITGKHKQVFDMPNPSHGLGVIHIRNYSKAWKDNYNLEHPQVNAVGTLYFMTIPLGLTDPMWAKYKLGETIKETDSKTDAFAVRNHLPEGGSGRGDIVDQGARRLAGRHVHGGAPAEGHAVHHVQ